MNYQELNNSMDMTDTLLVIIDPQKDFISENGNYAKRPTGILRILDAKQKINQLLSTAEKTKTVIVFSTYKNDQFEAGLSICIPGTDGHAIDINADDTWITIEKTEHSCFSFPAFNQFLTENNIHQLIRCGFLAEYCVKQTAIDGIIKGYSVMVLKDFTGTGDDVQHRKDAILQELLLKGATIIDSR